MFFFSHAWPFGLLASQLLPFGRNFPSIDIPEIGRAIPYQDAHTSEIEKMITRPVEES